MSPVVGSTVHVPSPGTVNVFPSGLKVLPAGGFTNVTEVGSMLLFGSVSLPNTLTVVGVPTVPAAVSFVATGGSCG